MIDRIQPSVGHGHPTGDGESYGCQLIVLSNAVEEREEEYNEWHTKHIADVVAVPGIQSGQRLHIAASMGEVVRYKYMALFEVDVPDPEALVHELLRRVEAGELGRSSAMRDDHWAACYRPITPVIKAQET